MEAPKNQPAHGSSAKPRVLVAIANHGVKNRRFLDLLLAEYRSMSRYQLDIVVNSNLPKELGDDVEVRVGLPSADPWSLPFAHKRLFAERAEDYDLYIYSEDDTLLKECHIDAFVRATGLLPEDRIAGFMRYEVDETGRKTFSGMHSHFHWEARSVSSRGGEFFARHTNDHAACYILTRGQLRKAIASGGYLLAPERRGYGMPETAATDPYTQCGMTKVVCISRFDDFCLHHLPNAYCGKLGLDEKLARLEIARLVSLHTNGGTPARPPLFEPCVLHDGDFRNKPYYERPRRDVLAAIPSGTRSVLSVGCGCGATEAEMVKLGIKVTAVPLDEIVAASAEARGVEILPSDFDDAAAQLQGRRFECILMLDILQHLDSPAGLLATYRGFLEKDGRLLVSVPNCNHHGFLRRRAGIARNHAPSGSGASGRNGRMTVGHSTYRRVAKWLRQAGYGSLRDCGIPEGRSAMITKWTFGLTKGLLCKKLLLLAARQAGSSSHPLDSLKQNS
jgi:SAM-dependent methyltransferase